MREIIPDVEGLFKSLQRVRVEHCGPMEPGELAQRMAVHGRALCITATRAQARDLAEMLHSMDRKVLHLSTWMCPDHRRRILAEARTLLATDQPFLLVSTSLIEAGVDIDFPVVFRALSGLDSLVQAAGRCNREGKLEQGVLYVFELPGKTGGEQDRRRAACKAVLDACLPPFSPEATRLYFDELYSIASEAGLDEHRILESIRSDWMQGYFPFRSVAASFHLIESGNEAPLIIPYSPRARETLDALRLGSRDRSLHRRLRAWTVSVRERELNDLTRHGSASPVGYGAPYFELLNEDLYSGLDEPEAPAKEPETGLDTRDPLLRDAAGLVM